MTLGVIVLTHNQPEQMNYILQGIERQTRKPDSIVVMDDNSTTPYDMLKSPIIVNKLSYTDKLDKRSEARHIGSGLSNSDILVFLDGDIIPSPKSFETIINYFSNPAHSRNVLTGKRNDVDLTDVLNNYTEDGDITDLNPEDFASYGFALTKPMYDMVGGFDPNFRGWGWEDTDLCYRLLQHGARFHIHPRVQFNHINHSQAFSDVEKLKQIIDNATKLICKHEPNPNFINFVVRRVMELGMFAEFSRNYLEKPNETNLGGSQNG